MLNDIRKNIPASVYKSKRKSFWKPEILKAWKQQS